MLNHEDQFFLLNLPISIVSESIFQQSPNMAENILYYFFSTNSGSDIQNFVFSFSLAQHSMKSHLPVYATIPYVIGKFFILWIILRCRTVKDSSWTLSCRYLIYNLSLTLVIIALLFEHKIITKSIVNWNGLENLSEKTYTYKYKKCVTLPD